MKELAAIPRERRENVKGNCGKLNAAASPYFNGGLVPMTKVGRFTCATLRIMRIMRNSSDSLPLRQASHGHSPFLE
jgi:hypothetical protein